jgi:hypothetical protein
MGDKFTWEEKVEQPVNSSDPFFQSYFGLVDRHSKREIMGDKGRQNLPQVKHGKVGGRVGREMKLKGNKTEEYNGAKMEERETNSYLFHLAGQIGCRGVRQHKKLKVN